MLRTIVQAGFDFSSYNSEEPVFDPGSVFERSVLPRLIEQRYPAVPWQEFAAAARLDADPHLFKATAA